MIHGLPPGPLLVKQAPDVFWGIITSMYIGNAMLLVLNLPLIPMWARLLRVPYTVMYPLILLFCLIGAYSVGNNIGDGIVMWVFGIVGYLLNAPAVYNYCWQNLTTPASHARRRSPFLSA